MFSLVYDILCGRFANLIDYAETCEHILNAANASGRIETFSRLKDVDLSLVCISVYHTHCRDLRNDKVMWTEMMMMIKKEIS
jgi:hypothetical protein